MDNINTVLWNMALGVVAISIIVCNLLFLFTVFKNSKLRRMRTSLFLISLTATDLIVGVVTIPMFMASLLWPGNKVANNMRDVVLSYQLIDIVTVFASLFLLAAIALERVYSVFWPYKHRALRKTPYYCALFTSWLLAILLMILYLLQWYDFIALKPFYCSFPCLTAVVIIIIVSYFAMWRQIKASRMEGLPQKRDQQERKLVMSLAILTSIFLITWLPFGVVHAVVQICTPCRYKIPIHLVYTAKLLHYSNSIANPVVYSFRFPEVRRTLAETFCKSEPSVKPTDFQMAGRGEEHPL